MKIFRYIAAALAAASILACSGTVDDSSLPVLEVSDAEIDLATETQAVFTVTYDGVDVTADAQIYSNLSSSELEGNIYIPENEGSAIFYAVYGGKESNSVTVNVINSRPQIESIYDRHVLVAEFTGAWCINCPTGYSSMMGVLSKPALKKYKENIHICGFHSNLEGTDTLAIAATQDLFNMFSGLAYPSFATDLRDSGILTSDGIATFQPSLVASFEEYGAHCGVAVSSVLSADKSSAEVTVKVASELTSEYRVALFVVEGSVTGWQKSTTYPEGQSDYVHKHVVRRVATTYPQKTFAGEKITADGLIAKGSEASKTWTVELDSKWELSDLEIYAIALDSKGHVNNLNVCAVDGGDSGYDLK